MRHIYQKRLVLPALLGGLLFLTALAAPCLAADPEDEIVLNHENGVQLLSPEDMTADRGAFGIEINENTAISSQSLAATTSGNALTVGGDLANGHITIGNQFGGSGFGSYVMNTGNNSTLMAATSVTIQMTPGP